MKIKSKKIHVALHAYSKKNAAKIEFINLEGFFNRKNDFQWKKRCNNSLENKSLKLYILNMANIKNCGGF